LLPICSRNIEWEDENNHHASFPFFLLCCVFSTVVDLCLNNFFLWFAEMSRQQRKERKKRQKWFWGSVGLAVTLGATAIAWSYLPSSQPQATADSNSASSE
jgi:threonine/homoserine/homoserine lactone efflux protein